MSIAKPDPNYFRPEKLKGGVLRKKSFQMMGTLSKDSVNKVYDFAYAMAFGDGHHRTTRSGGTSQRSKLRIFLNAFQGKLGEYAFYQWMTKNNPSFNLVKPDLKVSSAGYWDDGDFLVNEKNVSVKTSSFYSNLLLLETKDYDADGFETKFTPPKKVDVFVMVRMALMIKKQLISLDRTVKTFENPMEDPEFRKTLVASMCYEISGFITNNDFKNLVSQGFLLRRGEVVNRTTTMDANNYYIAVRDLRNPLRLLVNSRQQEVNSKETLELATESPIKKEVVASSKAKRFLVRKVG